MYSHQQINALFRNLADRHYQINSYGIGAFEDIGTAELELYVDANHKNTPVYPLMWAIPVGYRIAGKESYIKYDILYCDTVDDNLKNEQDVLNDQLLIAQDIWNALTNPDYRDFFVVGQTVNAEPFRQKFNDQVSGWKFTIEMQVHNLKDRCAIPMMSGAIGTGTAGGGVAISVCESLKTLPGFDVTRLQAVGHDQDSTICKWVNVVGSD